MSGPGGRSMASRRARGQRFKGNFQSVSSMQENRPAVDLDSKATILINGVPHDVHSYNLKIIKQLGHGAHGTVDLMQHTESGMLMAVKRIALNPTEQKLLEKEIDVLKTAQACPNVVHFYGAWFQEGSVWICMEAMDVSLTKFYKTSFDNQIVVPDDVVGVVAVSVLKALDYLKKIEVIHRDVKPSNILVNRDGHVKICDFGISGRLIDSRAKTQVGCSMYMAPERVDPDAIQEDGYDIRSDVWSYGLTLMELATGKYPFDEWKTPFQQIQQVVYGEPPQLPEGSPNDFRDFISHCLQKDYQKRPKYVDLLQHPFILRHENTDAKEFIVNIINAATKN